MTTEVKLKDGVAVHMGEGVFTVLQRDERGRPQNVVLTEDDLRQLLGLKG